MTGNEFKKYLMTTKLEFSKILDSSVRSADSNSARTKLRFVTLVHSDIRHIENAYDMPKNATNRGTIIHQVRCEFWVRLFQFTFVHI